MSAKTQRRVMRTRASVSGELERRCNEKSMMLYSAASPNASVELVYSFDAYPCRCPCKSLEKETRELKLGVRYGKEADCGGGLERWLLGY